MNDKRLLQLQALVASDPNDPFLHYAIAQEYIAAENWTEARNKLIEVQANFPAYLPCYYQLGMVLFQNGQESESLEILEKGQALAIQQNDRKTANEIAALMEEIEDMVD